MKDEEVVTGDAPTRYAGKEKAYWDTKTREIELLLRRCVGGKLTYASVDAYSMSNPRDLTLLLSFHTEEGEKQITISSERFTRVRYHHSDQKDW